MSIAPKLDSDPVIIYSIINKYLGKSTKSLLALLI